MIEVLRGSPPNVPVDPRSLPGSPNELLEVLILPRGRWLLFGRAKVRNNDGSGQGHSLHLRADNSDGGLLDWVDNYTGGDTSENMKVQGFVEIREWAGAVVMTCTGFKVSGSLPSLIAIKVDNFGPGYADRNIPPTGIPPEPPQHRK